MELPMNQEKTKVKKQTRFRMVMKSLRKKKSAMICLGFVIFLILLGIIAPYIVPYRYDIMDPANAMSPPGAEHWFGTDDYGRDIFSRLLVGIRYSLGLGFLAPLVNISLGIIFGSLAGYYGGWVDNIIMRFMDILQAIPGMMLAILISATLGGGFWNTCLALGIGGIPAITRLLRAQILTVRDMEYMEAARAINCSKFRQIVNYILPNAISPLIVAYTMGVGSIILSAASLSYLGLGIQAPLPEWGAMISGAKPYIRSSPYMIIFPGIFLAVTVIAINIFGDGLRDALDPKMKK
ncbi:MAG: ABC transporter permease [Erysipelotrichaceae bacterium]|nr:ABC transporter permease [Erysipelotrichaceae bacterium]